MLETTSLMLKRLKTSQLLRYRVIIQVVGLPTGGLAGSVSLLENGARIWDTEYCNTSANSDLACLAAGFLPFTARRRTNQLTRNNHTCQLPPLIRSQASPDLAWTDRQSNRQTRKFQGNYGTSWGLCVHPAGKNSNSNHRHD